MHATDHNTMRDARDTAQKEANSKRTICLNLTVATILRARRRRQTNHRSKMRGSTTLEERDWP